MTISALLKTSEDNRYVVARFLVSVARGTPERIVLAGRSDSERDVEKVFFQVVARANPVDDGEQSRLG